MQPEDSQDTQNSPAPQKPSKGYGKRPMWQWVVIYLLIAIVVYGLIYLVFIRKTGSSPGASSGGY